MSEEIKEMCNLDDPEVGHWGCCCTCFSRLKVIDRLETEDEVKMYVCSVFHDMKDVNKAPIISLHGVCEAHRDKEEVFREHKERSSKWLERQSEDATKIS